MARRHLTPDLLVRGYQSGYFPMADPSDGRIGWFSPDPRAIIPLDGLRVSRSLRRTLRRTPFDLASDRDFEGVIRACAARPETWISGEIVAAYAQLFGHGMAHTVESPAGGPPGGRVVRRGPRRGVLRGEHVQRGHGRVEGCAAWTSSGGCGRAASRCWTPSS